MERGKNRFRISVPSTRPGGQIFSRAEETAVQLFLSRLAPDLVVEVLSDSNTAAEMERKLRDFFAAGSSLVWYIQPANRSATAYISPDEFTVVANHGTLDGSALLPGFALFLRTLFERAGHRRQ